MGGRAQNKAGLDKCYVMDVIAGVKDGVLDDID
jgi:hypothetical protein